VLVLEPSGRLSTVRSILLALVVSIRGIAAVSIVVSGLLKIVAARCHLLVIERPGVIPDELVVLDLLWLRLRGALWEIGAGGHRHRDRHVSVHEWCGRYAARDLNLERCVLLVSEIWVWCPEALSVAHLVVHHSALHFEWQTVAVVLRFPVVLGVLALLVAIGVRCEIEGHLSLWVEGLSSEEQLLRHHVLRF